MRIDLDLEKKIAACQDPIKLTKLAMEHPGSERFVAMHDKADRILLRRLATHGDKYVRLSVAQHENCDLVTLKELARDREVVVREAARLNMKLKRSDSTQSPQSPS